VKKPGHRPNALAELLDLTERLVGVPLDAIDAEIEEAELRVNILRQAKVLVEIAQGKVEAVPEAEYRVRINAGAADRKCVPALESSRPIGRPDLAGEWVNPRRLAIAKYLAANGPQRLTDIGRALGIKSGSISSYVSSRWGDRDGWFTQTTDGLYDLTDKGRSAANQDRLTVGDNRDRRKHERKQREALLELRAIGTKLEAKL